MAIKIFFHICAITRCKDIVKHFINCIYFSGLYDDCDKIYCYVSGEIEIIEQVLQLISISGKKFCVIKCIPHDDSFERLTLEDIHNHVDITDKILYIHSKGVRKEYQNNINLLTCIDDWTNTMLYYLIRHYKTCINRLDTYDTVGVTLNSNIDNSGRHWSGNFWWVTGDYFVKLPYSIGKKYHDPELNFLFLKNPKYFEIHRIENNCYNNRYEPYKYIDSVL